MEILSILAIVEKAFLLKVEGSVAPDMCLKDTSTQVAWSSKKSRNSEMVSTDPRGTRKIETQPTLSLRKG